MWKIIKYSLVSQLLFIMSCANTSSSGGGGSNDEFDVDKTVAPAAIVDDGDWVIYDAMVRLYPKDGGQSTLVDYTRTGRLVYTFNFLGDGIHRVTKSGAARFYYGGSSSAIDCSDEMTTDDKLNYLGELIKSTLVDNGCGDAEVTSEITLTGAKYSQFTTSLGVYYVYASSENYTATYSYWFEKSGVNILYNSITKKSKKELSQELSQEELYLINKIEDYL